MRGENVNNKRVTKRFENLLGRRAGGGAFAEGNTARRNNNVTSSSSIIARMNPFNSDENNASCLVSCEGLKGSLRFSKIDFDDNSIVRKYQLKVYDDDKDDDNNEDGDEEKKTSTKKRVVNARDIAHFEFIDDNQIVFAQRNSKNILYAELTKAVHSPCKCTCLGNTKVQSRA